MMQIIDKSGGVWHLKIVKNCLSAVLRVFFFYGLRSCDVNINDDEDDDVTVIVIIILLL